MHIPFCRTICPYCPYFKKKFSKAKVVKFSTSLLKEIELHREHLTGKKIDSLYIGGGTPTLMNTTLLKAIKTLKSFCSIEKIAIETNPEEINKHVLQELREMGCNLISLGIQDFNKKYLNLIGRQYSPDTALDAIRNTKAAGFETVNIDLIFAYPGQSLKELNDTLDKAIACDVDQITLYPLFTFPYSSIGKFNRAKKIILPNAVQRKRFYFKIIEKLNANGYHQISVWGFLKSGRTKYSSVTRDYYLGLGPSAATYTGKQFLFNSFNLAYYQKQIDLRKLPYSLIMNVSENLKKLFWIYWRFYETAIPLKAYKQLFRSEFKKDFGKILFALRILGYAKNSDERITLNKKGTHRIHLWQNYFALNFVNQIWSISHEKSNPKLIQLQ